MPNIKDFTRGWFIGNFDPSIIKTQDFEVGIMIHKKNDHWPTHFHKIITEYNIVLEGKIQFNDRTYEKGDIFIVPPYTVALCNFLEDCSILVIKTPSVPSDKHLV